MGIELYYSSVASNMEIKKQQQRIEMILDGKKISYEKFDVAAEEGLKLKMRDLAGDEKALPPQLAKDGQYLGDFAAFDNAVESEELSAFLKM